jgi:hypothetical protein
MALTGRKQLGEILVQVGLITEEQLAEALQLQQALGGRLGAQLMRMGLVREEDVLRCLSDQFRVSYVDFREIEIPQRALDSVPIQIAKKLNVVPVALQRRRVVLAMSDPTDLEMIKRIEFDEGLDVLQKLPGAVPELDSHPHSRLMRIATAAPFHPTDDPLRLDGSLGGAQGEADGATQALGERRESGEKEAACRDVPGVTPNPPGVYLDGAVHLSAALAPFPGALAVRSAEVLLEPRFILATG